jgi:hypothetical protein
LAAKRRKGRKKLEPDGKGILNHGRTPMGESKIQSRKSKMRMAAKKRKGRKSWDEMAKAFLTTDERR